MLILNDVDTADSKESAVFFVLARTKKHLIYENRQNRDDFPIDYFKGYDILIAENCKGEGDTQFLSIIRNGF